MPSSLLQGRSYIAELRVETATQIEDAEDACVKKLSLPHALLQIQS